MQDAIQHHELVGDLPTDEGRRRGQLRKWNFYAREECRGIRWPHGGQVTRQ